MVSEQAVSSNRGSHSEADSLFGLLQDMVLESADVQEFLTELTHLAVDELASPGRDVFCGVTLMRHHKAGTVASSSEQARNLDEIQYAFGDGPCLTAARTHQVAHISDIVDDPRWPEYTNAVAKRGVKSVLGVPVPLDGDADCGLNLYSTTSGAFDEEAVSKATIFARTASKSLRLAVRMAHLGDTAENLKAAMASRTTIDISVGIIMAQNRCGQDAAVDILKSASSGRNMKLREIAAAVVVSVGHGTASTHFND